MVFSVRNSILRPIPQTIFSKPMNRGRRGGGGGAPAFVATGLPAWSAAVNAMKAGTRNAKIMCLGDSTTFGYGAGSTGGIADGYPLSYPQRLRAKLDAMGLRARAQNYIGNMNQSPANLASFDTRLVFTGTWSMTSEALGTQMFLATTNSEPLTFSPTEQFDTVEFRTMRRNLAQAGTIQILLDGAVIDTINLNNATDIYIVKTYNVPLGVHTLGVQKSAGTQGYAHSFSAWNSAAKEITVITGARPSGTAETICLETFQWSGLNALKTFTPDLTIINGILNNLAAPNQATIEDALTRAVAAARVSGDALLVIPNATSNTTQMNIVYPYVQNVATATNCPIIDLRTVLGTYAQASAAGRMFDTVHPNAAGYEIIAEYIFQRITH